MLQAYFDDSGTHQTAPVVVVGGLIGLKDNWENLDQQWKTKLAAPMEGKAPLKMFHLSHCAGHLGEFRDYTTTEGDVLRHDFRQIMIGTPGLFHLSCVVSRVDWDELVVPPYRDLLGSAEEACFLGFVNLAISFVRLNGLKDKISFVYDVGRKSERFDELIRLIEMPKYRPEVASVSWGRVAELTPLQAADTIATENYWASQKWLRDGHLSDASAHFQRLLEEIQGVGFIMDREAIQTEINRRGPDGRVR